MTLLSAPSVAGSIASVVLGPIQFDRPAWLWLLVPSLVFVIWCGRRSLAGLEGWTRWGALAARLVVVTLLLAVAADPSSRKRAEHVSVTILADASRSIPASVQEAVDRFAESAAEQGRRRGDRLGVITAAEDAFVQALPSERNTTVERRFTGGADGTDLAAGVRLALAVSPKDAAPRLVIASDGNETSGSLLEAARAAAAQGVPIDVIPLRYRYPAEVIVDRIIVPASAREGQTINIRIALTATRATEGTLLLKINDELVDLDPDAPGMGARVSLVEGLNLHAASVDAGESGSKRFEATFEPDARAGRPVGDEIAENNRALGVTFVSGEGRILLVRPPSAEGEAEAAPLLDALADARLDPRVIRPDTFPVELSELAGYDALILLNQEAGDFSLAQQQIIAQYVHDIGGGLIVIGGPQSFGAGGWIGSPLADALPVKLDPPQRKDMPRGALVLIMHSIEMPQGVYYGRRTAEAAVNVLAPQDLAGIIEYRGLGGPGAEWVHPLSAVGDKGAIRRAIGGLAFGDMPSFDPSLRLALEGLRAADAGQKHAIIISDGDPSLTPALLRDFAEARITISTVGVNPHSPGDLATLANVAQATGGRFWNIPNAQIASIPEIFVKEARVVRRSLIWEGDPLAPELQLTGSDALRGIDALPSITGYVVTADREGLSRVLARVGKENDPLAAEWQHGLGRVFVFTSDTGVRWARAWPAQAMYRPFWDRAIRWAMRPTGSNNLRIATEDRGDETLITVEALDASGNLLGAGLLSGALARPDGTSSPLSLRQVGPGRWEGTIRSADPGTYVLGVNLLAPGAEGAEPIRAAAQAAVTRPFADEFRALEDNTALLRQVAAQTGGRVLFEVGLDRGEVRLAGDPAKTDLFTRDGITMPVATRSIWQTLAIVALALFILDVAIRRVRLEPRAALAYVRRVLSRAPERAGARLDALSSVRAKARSRLDQRAQANPGAERSGPSASIPPPGDVPDPALAARKYEPAPGPPRPAPDRAPGAPGQDRSKPRPGSEAEPESGLSRLRAAKRRAQEEMNDDHPPAP